MSPDNTQEEAHRCKENWYSDAEIRYEKINREEWSWVLEQTWYANQEEVDDGAAEHVGDVISSHTVLITYCPFCGRKLAEGKANTW